MSDRLAIVAVAFCAALLAACGEQVPSESTPVQTNLCKADFDTCIMPILSGQIVRRDGATVSCMSLGCHFSSDDPSDPPPNGGRFTLGTDFDKNFLAVSRFIDPDPADVERSLVLIEPTQDDILPSSSAGFHGGGEIFSDRTNDQCFVTIRTWANNTGACGCTQVTNTATACGYP